MPEYGRNYVTASKRTIRLAKSKKVTDYINEKKKINPQIIPQVHQKQTDCKYDM